MFWIFCHLLQNKIPICAQLEKLFLTQDSRHVEHDLALWTKYLHSLTVWGPNYPAESCKTQPYTSVLVTRYRKHAETGLNFNYAFVISIDLQNNNLICLYFVLLQQTFFHCIGILQFQIFVWLPVDLDCYQAQVKQNYAFLSCNKMWLLSQGESLLIGSYQTLIMFVHCAECTSGEVTVLFE